MSEMLLQRQKGFTIVELLIVIVVIAILASISIVAYSGIQARAENTKTINGIDAYTKLLGMYAADNGTYPSAAGYPCLDTTAAAGCAVVSGASGCGFSGTAPNIPGFFTALAPYAKSMPVISKQTMSCSGQMYMGAYLNDNSADLKNLTITVFLKGNLTCPISMGSAAYSYRSQADQTTLCGMVMPTL